MYVNLNGEYLKKNWKKMNDSAKEDYEDVKDDLLEKNANMTTDECYFENGILTVTFDGDLGYISENITLSDDLMFKIIEHLKDKGRSYKKFLDLVKEE